MTGLIITTKHLRTIPGFHTRPGFCLPLAKEWAKSQGIDWKAFVRDGIPAETLTATGDAFALALVDWARTCEEQT